MRYWFDLEFIDRGRRGISVLSAGMVAEDDRTLYLEVEDEPTEDANDFVRANVLPFLGMNGGSQYRPRTEVAAEIVDFVSAGPGAPQLWAWYGSYDWVGLSGLYGTLTQRPKGWGFSQRDVLELTRLAWGDDGEDHMPTEVQVAAGMGLALPDNAHHALAGAYFARSLWRTAKREVIAWLGDAVLEQIGAAE